MDGKIIGSIIDFIYAIDDPAAAVEKMASEDTKIVSLTVTEKGYSQDISTGDLDLNDENIKHDLKNLATPKTAIGYVVSALEKRRTGSGKSFTVLSCDNLQGNGDMTLKLVM